MSLLIPRWRVLVHSGDGKRSHDITSNPDAAAEQAKRQAWFVERGKTGYCGEPPIVLAATEFDEVVVGEFLHLEQMDRGYWWANIAGVTVHVRADRDGRPTHVMVHGPGDYDDPAPGCRYELVWSHPG